MSKLYKGIISVCDKFVPGSLRPLWEHPAGPKTIFFWAPAFKWGLVIGGLGYINRPAEKLSIPHLLSLTATGMVWSRYSLVTVPKSLYLLIFALIFQGLVIGGLGDINRPAEKLSIPQLLSLSATGVVWSRYSLVIIPKNYSLFSVNVVVATINIYQLTRAFRYRQSLKK